MNKQLFQIIQLLNENLLLERLYFVNNCIVSWLQGADVKIFFVVEHSFFVPTHYLVFNKVTVPKFIDKVDFIDKLFIFLTDFVLHSFLPNWKFKNMFTQHFIKLLLFGIGITLLNRCVELSHDYGFEWSKLSQSFFIKVCINWKGRIRLCKVCQFHVCFF